MTAILFNYAILIQFGIASVAWFFSGNKVQALYWAGAFICTLAVTIG